MTTVIDYWRSHLIDEGECAVCANDGTFRSAGTGRRMFCLCPNGQQLRKLPPTSTPLVDPYERAAMRVSRGSDLQQYHLDRGDGKAVCLDAGYTNGNNDPTLDKGTEVASVDVPAHRRCQRGCRPYWPWTVSA